MKQTNKFIPIGLLFNSIFLLSSHFDILPDFFEGAFVALGLMFLGLGLYSKNHDLKAIREFKLNMFKKVFSK